MTSAPFVARFQLQMADVQVFFRFIKVNTNKNKLWAYFLVLLIMATASGVAAFYSRHTQVNIARTSPKLDLFTLSILSFIFVVSFAFFLLSDWLKTKKRQKNSLMLQHENTVTLTNEDFQVSYGSTTITTHWSGVERVIGDAEYLFLFTSPKDGYLVPRRAFTSNEDFMRFCDFARQRYEQHQPAVPPIVGA